MPGVIAEHVAYRTQEAADRAAMYDQGKHDIRESLDLHLAEVPMAERLNDRGLTDRMAMEASAEVRDGQYPTAIVPDIKPIDTWHIDAYESGMHSEIAAWMSEHHQPYGATEMLMQNAKNREVLDSVERRFAPQNSATNEVAISQKGENKLEEQKERPVYVEQKQDIEAMARTVDGPFSTKTAGYDPGVEVYTTVLKPDGAASRSLDPTPFAYSQETIGNQVREMSAQRDLEPQEQRFETIRERISGREESLREQFVTANATGDPSRNAQLAKEAHEINQEIAALGKQFPQHREALPTPIDVERMQQQLPERTRERESISLGI
jgi:hypothetical protein